MKEFLCSLDAAMYLIGGKWKLFIIWSLKDGKKRFNQLSKLIPAVTQKMLTQQIRELERDQIIRRTVYPQVPLKVEYSLTETGEKLLPIIKNLCMWAYETAAINNYPMNL